MKFIFVYNADAGLFNLVSDWAHKVVSPSTYECNLCALTYGNFGMNKEWKEFLDGLDTEMEFLHKDEFIKKYGNVFKEFPCILIEKDGNLKEVVSKSEINNCKTILDLKEKVKTHIQ